MKAITFTQYGSPDVLQFTEVNKPVPKDNQVLIKILASSLNSADWHTLRADPFLARLFSGLFKPNFNILGADIAGVIEATGKDVKQFKVGDEVYGDLASYGFGGFAEYVCVQEKAIALKPKNQTFEEASAMPLAAMTAIQGLRDKGELKMGQKVLIYGASGGVGTFAIQIAIELGAEVTAVCSTRNMDQARKLGAHHVIDYTLEDFTKNGQQYDLIFAVNGFRTLVEYKNSLKPNGQYLMAGGTNAQIFQALLRGPFISMFGKKKMGALTASANQKDLNYIKELVEAGKLKPVIDRYYPLSQVADAFRYMEAVHAQGKIVIQVNINK